MMIIDFRDRVYQGKICRPLLIRVDGYLHSNDVFLTVLAMAYCKFPRIN